MSPAEALARRAVAAPGWSWLPGMLAVEDAVPGMALWRGPQRVTEYWTCDVGLWLPDLADAATLGCLLALVRDLAKAEWDAILANPSGIRQVITMDANGYPVLADRRPPTPINDAYTRALSMLAITSDSEALHQALAALVAALEAAPRRTP